MKNTPISISKRAQSTGYRRSTSGLMVIAMTIVLNHSTSRKPSRLLLCRHQREISINFRSHWSRFRNARTPPKILSQKERSRSLEMILSPPLRAHGPSTCSAESQPRTTPVSSPNTSCPPQLSTLKYGRHRRTGTYTIEVPFNKDNNQIKILSNSTKFCLTVISLSHKLI